VTKISAVISDDVAAAVKERAQAEDVPWARSFAARSPIM